MPGSGVKDRVVYPLQKRVLNPVVLLAWRLGFPPPGDALLETTGRRTGRARLTPVCDGADGDTFWLIAQRGQSADWVRNIEANPRVRVKFRAERGVRWRTGAAHVVDGDDAGERRRRISEGDFLRRLCLSTAGAIGSSPLTVRIDLDASPRS